MLSTALRPWCIVMCVGKTPSLWQGRTYAFAHNSRSHTASIPRASHPSSDTDKGLGLIACRVCGEKYQTTITGASV